MTNLADPLSAASLLMAIIAMLYGAWSPDMTQAANLVLKPLKLDRKGQRDQIVGVLQRKALPLVIGAWFALIVFLGRTVSIIGTLWNHPAGSQFDDVSAAFVLTQLFTLALAYSVTSQSRQLWLKIEDCDKPDAQA